VDIITPYYFNIAPDKDLTVYPRLLSKRGVQMAETYRYMSKDYAGTLTTEFLPNDEITHTNRYAIYFQHQQNLGDGFYGFASYNRVSDGTYPQDLSSSTTFSQALSYTYQQSIGVAYNSGPWFIIASMQHWQVLPAAQGSAPYARAPQVNVKYTKYNVDGFDYGVEADATNFRVVTADSYQGSRLYVDPYVSYPIIRPDFYVIPKLQAHLASYNLTSIPSTLPPGQVRDPSVAIPTFSLDSGTTFERTVSIFGTDYIQTLEPRLYYVYTPYVNQLNVPIFDTADTDFGIAEVFAPNTFVGGDRVADQSRTVVGLTSRFINAASGDERARFLFAQQYYFKPQTVTLQTSTQPLTGIDRADVIVGAQFHWGAGLATESALDYSNSQNLIMRTVEGVTWNPGDRQVLNVSYRYNRANSTIDNQPINQALVSTQWPLTRHLYGVARLDYDMSAKQIVDGVIGFQYDADCWAFGMGIQRYSNGLSSTTGAPTSGTRVLAQLQLKGLSTLDNGLIQNFAAGVQGYQNVPGPAPALSRFSNFP
jgi:LPS-assembly protein